MVTAHDDSSANDGREPGLQGILHSQVLRGLAVPSLELVSTSLNRLVHAVVYHMVCLNDNKKL